VAPDRLVADQKSARRRKAHLVLIDGTGRLLDPLVRRSWSLRGKTPVIGGDGGHRKKVSVIGAVSVSPTARRLGFYFATLPDGFFTAEAVVGFLRALLQQLRGNVVVVWDGGPHHNGPVVRSFLRRNRRLRLKRLPPYAPDRNPVEAVWGWLKYGELANHVPDGLGDLDDEIVDRRIEPKFAPDLLRGLWEASDLPFPGRRRDRPG
jgi:putative transposase